MFFILTDRGTPREPENTSGYEDILDAMLRARQIVLAYGGKLKVVKRDTERETLMATVGPTGTSSTPVRRTHYAVPIRRKVQ